MKRNCSLLPEDIPKIVVILSAAKNLASLPSASRSFAALRMTSGRLGDDFWRAADRANHHSRLRRLALAPQRCVLDAECIGIEGRILAGLLLCLVVLQR